MTPLRTSVLSVALFGCAATLAAQAWRTGAEADIARLRTAPLTVELVGGDAAGATVDLRQTRSEFVWGTTVAIQRSLNLVASGVPVGGDDPYYLHLLDFNSATPENAGKWKFWERASLREHYGEVAAWLRSQGVSNRGHGAIWPSIRRWNAVPDDVLALRDSLDAGGRVVATKNDRVRARVRGHIESYVRTMAAWGVYELDLVNELVHEGDLTTDVMGLTRAESIAEYAQWYKWAAAAAPQVKLVVNEYDLLQSGNGFHRDFVAFVRGMIDLGAPVSSIGMQGHFFGPVPEYAELRRRLDEVAVLGLPMTVTEFDMNDTDAASMDRVLHAVFAHPNVYGFTIWGAWDGQQWRGNAPIYDRDWRRKPSGVRYFDLVQGRWQTDTTYAYVAGAPAVKVYRGTYTVTVKTPRGLIVREVEVPAAGTTVEIDLGQATTPEPQVQLQTGLATGVVLANAPARLTVIADAEIRRVQYFVDGLRVAVRLKGDSAYAFRVPDRGTLEVSAVVEFASGLTRTLGPLSYTVDATNAAPRLQRVSPASNTVYRQRDSIRIQVEASDPDGDRVEVKLLSRDGSVVAADSEPPYVFVVNAAAVGQNDYRIVVEDTRFGQASIDYQIIIVDESREVNAKSSPVRADDDIEESLDGSIDLEGDLDLGQRHVGVRFFPKLPRGAEITQANVQFVNQKDSQTGPFAITIRADARALAPGLAGVQRNLTSRPKTSAAVAWSINDPWLGYEDAGPEQRTPDVASVLNEVLALDGFSENSPVVVLFSNDEGGNKRSAFSVDQAVASAPQLLVRYTAPNPSDTRVTAATFVADQPEAGRLTWTISAGDAAARVFEVYLDGAAEPRIVEGNELALEGLERDRDYTARIVLLDELGSPRPPFVYTFRLGVVNTKDLVSREPLSIYPNPSADVIYLEAAGPGVATVVDAVGRIVAQVDLESNVATRVALPVGHLPTGSYRVIVRSALGWRVGAFVKS